MKGAAFNFLTYTGYEETPFHREMSTIFGRALRLLSRAPFRRDLSLKEVVRNLWPPVKLGQIEFLYNSHGEALAFATWAYLTPEVAELFRVNADYRLELHEWNEGDQLWIVDFFSPYGGTRNLCTKLRRSRFLRFQTVHAVRSYANDKVSRTVAKRLYSKSTTE